MSVQKNRRTLRRSAFTLMEMLVVVAIIVMLAGIGGYALLRQYDKAKRDTAKAQSKELTKACKSYYLRHSTFPPNLQALLVDDEQGVHDLDTPESLKDPWGQPYQYNAGGAHNGGRQPDIWSTCGGSGEAGNW
jgi:general secretion pathway protein G